MNLEIGTKGKEARLVREVNQFDRRKSVRTLRKVRNSPKHHPIVLLIARGDMTYAEIARQCGCKPQWVSIIARQEWAKTKIEKVAKLQTQATTSELVKQMREAAQLALNTLISAVEGNEVGNDTDSSMKNARPADRIAACKVILEKVVGKAADQDKLLEDMSSEELLKIINSGGGPN